MLKWKIGVRLFCCVLAALRDQYGVPCRFAHDQINRAFCGTSRLVPDIAETDSEFTASLSIAFALAAQKLYSFAAQFRHACRRDFSFMDRHAQAGLRKRLR